VKNFLGTKIVTLGGSWGKYSPQAPDIARKRFGMEIIDVSYDDLAQRIKGAQADKRLIQKSKAWAKRYMAIPKTSLKTDTVRRETWSLKRFSSCQVSTCQNVPCDAILDCEFQL